MSMEDNFKRLLDVEEIIQHRRGEIDILRDNFERKSSIIQNIINDAAKEANAARDAILHEMEETGVVEFTSLGLKIRRKKKMQSVIIENESAIAGNYIITKTSKITTAPDKILIAKLLRAGHEVTGAKLSDEEYELEIKGK
jgi:hypothetical protein